MEDNEGNKVPAYVQAAILHKKDGSRDIRFDFNTHEATMDDLAELNFLLDDVKDNLIQLKRKLQQQSQNENQ